MDRDDDSLERPGSALLPSETLFESAPWIEAVEAGFGLRIDTFRPESEPGGLVRYSVVDDLRGRRIVSLPFSDFHEPGIATAAGWAECAAHLRLFEAPITLRPFRCPPALADNSFERRTSLLWHGIDVRDGVDSVLAGLKSKVRNRVTRAERLGFRLSVSSTIDDLRRMHTLHVDLRSRKYRMLAQPLGFFEALHEGFGDRLVVLSAELDGDLVSSMVFIEWDGVFYYKYGASADAPFQPNMALLVRACEIAEERRLRLVDLGRSDADQEGLVRFKDQVASHRLPLTTLHWSPVGTESADPDIGTLLATVTNLLTGPDVPIDVSRRAGAELYRLFA